MTATPLAAAYVAAVGTDREVSTYRVWLDSDEPRRWHLGDFSGASEDSSELVPPSEIEEWLRDWVEDGYLMPEERNVTRWIRAYADPIDPATDEPLDGARVDVHVIIEAEEPPCLRDREHSWEAPLDLVHGIEDNPGVQGHGGGVVITRVCSFCGRYRVTDTWATDPTTGRQGLTSVEYEDPDRQSIDWIERLRRADREEG